MSHYVVIVIGDNPEDQLAPFDENIQVPKYSDGEVSEREKQRFMEHYQKENPAETENKSFDEVFKMFGKKWDKDWRKDTDGVIRRYSTYNPNSKWDWYSLGGRWAGFFKLKEGADGIKGTPSWGSPETREGFADAAAVGDIDFEGMEREHREKAEAHYDKVMAVLGKHRPNKPWKHYRDTIDPEKGEKSADKARERYWAQARCKAYKEAQFGDGFYDSPDDFLCTREEYGNAAAASSYTPYGVIKDYEWFAKGEMGWWGMSKDAISDAEWAIKFREMIMSLPKETMLWAYDLHI